MARHSALEQVFAVQFNCNSNHRRQSLLRLYNIVCVLIIPRFIVSDKIVIASHSKYRRHEINALGVGNLIMTKIISMSPL